MTALQKYVRLEAIGVWRPAPGEPPREVIVSFGAATLVLTDAADRPLGHWALAGVQAIGRDGPATVFAMSPDGAETLAIGEREMVEAIAAVSRAHCHRGAAAPPPARGWLAPLVVVAVLAGAAALAPDLIRGQAGRMLPPEAVEEFGDQMLLQLMAGAGALCADPEGRRALDALAARVDRGDGARLRALELDAAAVALLPGPTIALGRAAIERAEDPAEIAGWVALALIREAMRPGPERLMAAVGTLASLRYVFTGRLSEAALARALESALTPPHAEEVRAAYDRLAAAGLATAPFADGLRRFGYPAPPATAMGEPALSDQDWVALQGLCT